jgi:hypothetical protein
MPVRASFPRAAAIAAALSACVSSRAAEGSGPWQPATLPIGFDANLSAEAGADDGIALQYAAGRLEDRFLKPRLWNEERFWPHLAGFGYRFGRALLIDDPVAEWLSTAQHEVFGHGYRGRENGYRDISYDLPLPPPYGRGGGLTWLRGPDTLYAPDRGLATNMAGVEAQAVQADRLLLLWTRTGSMDVRGARLYLEDRFSLLNYLSVTDESVLARPDPDFSNDMLAYILELNEKEDPRPFAAWRMHLKDVKNDASFSILDPFLWYSVWAYVATDLWQGRSYFRYPCLPLGPVRALPSIAAGLGPWGPEFRLQGLFAWEDRALSLGYRFGDATFRSSFGWDLVSLGLARWGGFILDGDMHYWVQPRLRVDPSDAGRGTPSGRRAGWAGALNALSPALPGRFPVRATVAGGWKSSGFVPGKDLRAGPYWRVGLAWTPGMSADAAAGAD